MHTLRVELGDRSYSIRVGRDLLPEHFSELRASHRIPVCIVDAEVERLHASRLGRILPDCERLIVPSGEESKRLSELERLARELLDLGLGRDGLLFAIGGGVTGDLAGFLAATYMRGIPFVQVPTTLLAQVDASVGGKVAVNLPGAKNSLGFFLQPQAVLTDLAFLDTLPRRELAAGLAEMLKMAASLDADFFTTLEGLGEDMLAPSSADLETAIHRSCLLKARVVESDERERGPRELLNFGHTLAHAIEGSGPDPAWLHGEAVAVGLVAALRLGEEAGVTPAGCGSRMEAMLGRLGLPCRLPPESDPARLLGLMSSDKKRRGGRLRFVLLEEWGRARHGVELEDKLVLSVLEGLRPESP